MSRDLQLQADVGSLGLQSLGAMSSILATLSRDNIVPMALVQMEKLGSNLPVNGKLAEDIKGLLQRCNDVRLDHFAFVIGWRKNDSASLMAESAGGQAIALLSVCLKNLFKFSDVGLILARLSSKLCPPGTNISSAAQLADVAHLLANKAESLGFGNHLAKEVARIHEVYRVLGLPSAPVQLLEDLSVESMLQILENVSQALCREDKICRITGHDAMGHVIGLIRALFPQNLRLTVEGVIIQDAEHPKILCEILDENKENPQNLTQISLETSISDPICTKLPIRKVSLTTSEVRHDAFYRFTWSGWMADHLRLIFMNCGLICSGDFVQAFCDLFALSPKSLMYTIARDCRDRPLTHLLALLGGLPQARISLICEKILGCGPTDPHMDLPTAFAKLLEATTAACPYSCNCFGASCDWSDGWHQELPGDRTRDCKKFELWRAIGNTLECGFWSFFIDAGPNVTICPQNVWTSHSYITDSINQDPKFAGLRTELDANLILSQIFGIVGKSSVADDTIITSSGSCTIYPTVLKNMEIPSHQLVTFELVEGQIVFEERYHRRLCAERVSSRHEAQKSLMDSVAPSHIGIYESSPLLTIREGFDNLELRLSVQFGGEVTKVDLRSVILGYIGMMWANPCPHPVTKIMDDKFDAFATAVSAPAAHWHLGVVMTRWNPMAQLLSCRYGCQAILQKECCLDCAAKMLGKKREGVIIVAC